MIKLKAAGSGLKVLGSSLSIESLLQKLCIPPYLYCHNLKAKKCQPNTFVADIINPPLPILYWMEFEALDTILRRLDPRLSRNRCLRAS